ncbi:PcfJ domain-containing protein [Bacillus atrophaeus]|uniref:PcfJ domain-containing protein n=1 Tax=Bacillus atrophaeus TaxID=1452 RepID=UPI002E1A82A3|nr:PcfJ domain-containing protein [Bacillus atrophaeus]
MSDLKKSEEVERLKDKIKTSGYPKYEAIGHNKSLIGTIYVKEKMDYGFHIFFIHEPSKTNKLAGMQGILSEMYYDLRNRSYWIKRNLKEVKFSERNVDSMFPFSGQDRSKIFELISTDNNQGLYTDSFNRLGAIERERTRKYGRFFYRLMTDYSFYELLYKAGIKDFSNNYIVDPKGSSPREVFGLTKTQWKMYVKFGVKLSTFSRGLNIEQKDNKSINLLTYVKSLEDEFGISKMTDFEKLEIKSLYKDRYRNDSAMYLANTYNLPEKKLIRYLYFECDVSQGISTMTAIREYRDYIRMTTEMGYERFDRYPKYLKTAHDIASRNYNVKLNEEELKEWNSRLANNKTYESTLGDYRIITPETPEDLVREGNVLGHCVGSYVGSVRKGLSTILFLREREDLEHPLVTIEIRNNQITQAYGRSNYPPKKAEKEAILKFAKKFELSTRRAGGLNE